MIVALLFFGNVSPVLAYDWGGVATINGKPASGKLCSGYSNNRDITCATPSPDLDPSTGKLSLNGTINIHAVAGDEPVSVAGNSETDPEVGAITNGELCYGSGGTVICDSSAPASGSDDLGNHTATQPIKFAGTGSETCNSSTVGQIRYNPVAKRFDVCVE